MYISNEVTWKRRQELEHRYIECVWTEICQKNSNVFCYVQFTGLQKAQISTHGF